MSQGQESVLDIINRHPEGITTSGIVDELFPGADYWLRVQMRNRTHRHCRILTKYGMVRQIVSGNGSRSVWGPLTSY